MADGGALWQVVPERELTLEQLAQHDGSDPSKPMLLAIRSVIFDITAGARQRYRV